MAAMRRKADEGNLVAVAPQERVRPKKWCSAPPDQTTARYSEASLLTAMEGAGKAMDDEELRAAMAGRGLGTPATRAQIIENLLTEQYCSAKAANCCRRPRPFR
jgi:DNA topoisomerase-3